MLEKWKEVLDSRQGVLRNGYRVKRSRSIGTIESKKIRGIVGEKAKLDIELKDQP